MVDEEQLGALMKEGVEAWNNPGPHGSAATTEAVEFGDF
jgi:hypothetical protein